MYKFTEVNHIKTTNGPVEDVFTDIFNLDQLQPKKKEKTPMAENKNYLIRRLETLNEKAENDLAKKFNICEDEYPHNAKEFVARIQAGKYVLPKTNENTGLTEYGMGPFGIFWRDPAVIPDEDGYQKALEALNAEKRNTRDAIEMLSDAEALAEFRKFQAYVATL